MMRRLIVLGTVILAVLVAPSLASAASTCSNLGYITMVQQVNAKALYANNLSQSGLYQEARSAYASALRKHTYGTQPCASALRSVRSTYQSGLTDWYTGSKYVVQGQITTALRFIKRGTAKINYATGQLTIYNQR